MTEIVILAAMGVGLFIIHVWPKISWCDEDWRHLRLDDSWDPAKSRGRIRERTR